MTDTCYAGAQEHLALVVTTISKSLCSRCISLTSVLSGQVIFNVAKLKLALLILPENDMFLGCLTRSNWLASMACVRLLFRGTKMPFSLLLLLLCGDHCGFSQFWWSAMVFFLFLFLVTWTDVLFIWVLFDFFLSFALVFFFFKIIPLEKRWENKTHKE